MKGLAADGGLFLPEEIPVVPDWVRPFGSQSLAWISPLANQFLLTPELLMYIGANAKSHQTRWKDLSYADLAFNIFRLYISISEIPDDDLKAIVDRSYSTFRAPGITPLIPLQGNLYALELFHGPSYSFKDCAL